MKFSVIIPCYHCEATIRRCAESLFNQSYRDCEFIFVEDGEEVTGLAEIAAQDTRAKVLRIPHGGVSCARNAGIFAAGGGYVTFCDSDDYYGCDVLQSYIDTLQEHPELDIVFTELLCHTPDGMTHCKVAAERSNANEYLQSQFDGTASGMVNDKCYRLSFLRQNNLQFHPGISTWEDWCFNVECYAAASHIGKVVIKSDDSRYHYVITPGSLTNSPPTCSNGLGACEVVKIIEQTLIKTEKHDAWYSERLIDAKILAKWLLLKAEDDGLREYYKEFPETNSVTLIWKHTNKQKFAYRLGHILAVTHLFFAYRWMNHAKSVLRSIIRRIRHPQS